MLIGSDTSESFVTFLFKMIFVVVMKMARSYTEGSATGLVPSSI